MKNPQAIITSGIAICNAVMLAVLCAMPSYAKQVGEALSDMGEVGENDPNGFKLMIFCIGLIGFLALTIFGVTAAYFLKSKKPKKS